MNNRLDELFREKLSDHSIPPSDPTWSRVKDSLSKKNSRILLFRIAAAVLLLAALASVVGRLSIRSAEAPALSHYPDPKPLRVPAQPPARATSPKQESKPRSQKEIRHADQPNRQNEELMATPNTSQTEQPAADDTVIPSTQAVVAEVSQTEKPIVLEYRLDAISSHPAPPVEIATREKSGLRRVIDLAWEAKNGDSPLSLRQTKDELFALNFKTKKISK